MLTFVHELSHDIWQPEGEKRKITVEDLVGSPISECFCIKFDPKDNYIAGGYGNGVIIIYDLATLSK